MRLAQDDADDKKAEKARMTVGTQRDNQTIVQSCNFDHNHGATRDGARAEE
jgi:hypothetical protein